MFEMEKVEIKNLHCSPEVLFIMGKILSGKVDDQIQKTCGYIKSLLPIKKISSVVPTFVDDPSLQTTYEVGPDGVLCKDPTNIYDLELINAIKNHAHINNLYPQTSNINGLALIECYVALNMHIVMCGDRIGYEEFWAKKEGY